MRRDAYDSYVVLVGNHIRSVHMKRQLIEFLAAVLAVTACPPNFAASAVDAQAEVAAVLYAASATQVAVSKALNSKLQAQQERIAALSAEVKAGDTRHRAQMAAAQEAFVQELATKDRQYAVQLSLFRTAVTDIASTARGAAALERFNAGDEVGAIDILDQLRLTNEQMRLARAKLEDAAEGRRIAQLAFEARSRGKLTTQAVVDRFENVVELDPNVWDDWLKLEGLYTDSGRLDDALRAADRLVGLSRSDMEKARAFSERSATLLLRGDLVAARAAAETALINCRRLVAEDPRNSELGYTLSRALNAFGEVARRQADFNAAQKVYLEGVATSRQRLAVDAPNARARSQLASDLLHLADVYIQLGNIAAARTSLQENLKLQEGLAGESPESTQIQRRINVTLMWLSDVFVSEGAFEEASQANSRLVANADRLSAADPANVVFKRDLLYGYLKTAMVARVQGEFGLADQTYHRGLEIAHVLAGMPAASFDMKIDVATISINIGEIEYLQGDLAAAGKTYAGAIAVLKDLASADDTEATSRNYLALALFGAADVQVAQGDFSAARRSYDEGIQLERQLLAKSRDAAEMENGLSVGQLGIGKLLARQGDRAGAIRQLEQSLVIRRQQASSRHDNSATERDVAEVMYELAAIPGSKVSWSDFRWQVEGMKSKGILWPADHRWLEEAQTHAVIGERS
jgi:tetratricopeptide (TPR) repeat protein